MSLLKGRTEWRVEMLAVLRTQGRVFLLLDSSLLRAHTVFSGFPPLCPGHSFRLVCRPLLLHPVAKRGGLLQVSLRPLFPFLHSLQNGFNTAFSFRCHLQAISPQTISTPDLSELQPLNSTMDWIWILWCLKFSSCSRQNVGSSLFPQIGLISYPLLLQLQSPGNSSLPLLLEPMDDQDHCFRLLNIWWLWTLHSSWPKLPSSFIWTCNKQSAASQIHACSSLTPPYTKGSATLNHLLLYLLPWTTPLSLCCCQADCLWFSASSHAALPSTGSFPPQLPHHKGFSSVQFSCSVVSDSLRPHEPQHARPPCPSPTPGVHPNPCPLCRWCHPTISSSVVPFSSCPQSFPASGSFQMSQLFTSSGRSIGASASTSVLPMNTQDWSPLRWTGWISLQPRDSQQSSPTPQFKSINSSLLSFLYSPTLTSIHDHWKNHSLD